MLVLIWPFYYQSIFNCQSFQMSMLLIRPKTTPFFLLSIMPRPSVHNVLTLPLFCPSQNPQTPKQRTDVPFFPSSKKTTTLLSWKMLCRRKCCWYLDFSRPEFLRPFGMSCSSCLATPRHPFIRQKSKGS